MTDQRPDAGDNTPSTENESTPPEPEEVAPAAEQPEEDATPADAEGPGPEEAEGAGGEADTEEAEAGSEEGEAAETEEDAAAADEGAAADVVAETEAEAADAAAAGAAWTTTPVAPDPEATEAALAALAAKPEVTLEPPETPPPPPGEEPEDEGTPVLLVGGILVGAFIVALAIVLILFRPFDSLTDVDASLSPSPVVTEEPSESPGISTVDTPSFVSLSLEEAEATASDYGLVIRVETVSTDEAEPGTVLAQDPEPGEPIEEGSTVELSVAQAVPTGSVPDVSGLSEEDAESVLEESGFAVGNIEYVYDDDVPAGGVISTDPATDSELPQGSTVDLVVSQGPALVAVPDLVDRPEAEALDLLDAAGLPAGDATQASDETIVAGNVISSDPAADSEVAPGTAVAYVVSTGPALVAVPDLVDRSEAEALDLLDAAGLAAGARSEEYSDTVAAGNIVDQDPAVGESIRVGSQVSYVVSLGVEQVEVPDLTGAAADAPDTITAAGLAVGSATQEYSESVATGDVISQSPDAGSLADVGSAVDYVESLGVEQIEVPSITDLAEADALDALDDAGLSAGTRLEDFSDTIAAGNVASQSPDSGAMVDAGSAVDYVISLGVETVAVPDLTGAAAEAPDAITAAGLAVGNATQEYSESVAAGDVISQNPEAGTMVELGSPVDYVESLGVQQVTVPEITGQAEADALDAIDGAGLVAGDRSEDYSDDAPAGVVINQSPATGESVDIGSAVDYAVSLGVEQVEVPSITAATEADALDAIDGAGLTAGNRSEDFSDSVAEGSVISQSPDAGRMVDIGSAVDYVVSLGVETAPVPDLTGAAADAPDAITAAGLTVGEATQGYSDSIPAGEVISQDPAPGTLVELGSAVSYVESLGVQQVEVPDLSGAAADADQKLADAGLIAGAVSEAYSDSVAAGDVIGQSPAAGESVDIGSAVDYAVSLGVETVEVPDLSGVAADAEQKLADAGLAGSMSEAYSDTVAAGDVISQDPAAGVEVEIGSTVSYVASLGVETVPVPDLSGAAADAPAAIEAAGLTVGEATQAYSASIPADDVLSQEPAAGIEVELGTAVNYVESLGVEQVEVPAVREMSQEDATGAIEAAGLIVGEVLERNNANVPAGAALRTEPAAGELADIGSSISLFMSIGPEQVEVPDVVGMTEADALAAIEMAKLATGARSDEFSDTVPAGNVTSTSPAAGTTVDAGSAVDYVLSLGIEQVAVPDVVDSTEADATAAIEAAGLIVGETTAAFDETIAAGNLVGQDPAAGSEVDKGSTVDVVVSDGPTPSVQVPAVRDLPEADAVAAIEAANLVVGEITEQTHEKVAAGNAIKTNPAEGEEILLGESVKLFISTGTKVRTIPDVAGQEAAEAQAALEAEGLVVAPDERTNAKYPAGQAVKTEPAAGTEAEIGDEVTLIVSRGPKQVDIPDVVGMTLGQAKTAISDAELKVGAETVVADQVARNTVIAQDPAPGGQADKDSTVDVTVSSGPPQVVVPEVRDVAAAEAQASLEAEGLVVATREAHNANVAQGNAVKTEPAAGTPVDVGSEVILTISKGPKPVVVPEVVGQKKGAARNAITDAGLVVGEETSVEDATPANTVINQDPVAGAEAPTGSAVNLTVSSGPPTVEIPEVRNVPAAEAQATLEGLGLVVETKEVHNANVAAGDAIKTAPAAGQSVALGSTVTMNVSKGPKPVVVPNVVGSKKGAARTAITDSGLVVGSEQTVEDPAARNTVIAQDPVAGTEVPSGSAVNLTISSGPPQVEMPAVKNTPAADAQATLEGLGLVVETDQRTNASVAAGNAVRTEPPAGELVDVGSTVTLIISKGPKMAAVPNVVGSGRGQAEAAIEDAKLAVGDVGVAESNEAKGTVLSQDPAAGAEVPQGTAVNLVISAGPPQVQIPEVKNSSQARAVNDLENLGLVVQTQERTNSSVAAGNAVKTEPPAGSTVDVGSTVTLTISKGPKQVTVPNIVGLPEDQVAATVTGAELQVGARAEAENPAAAGTVVAQNPAAGAVLDKNSTVDYTVSTGPAIEQMGTGGDLASAEVASQLDSIAARVQQIRGLDLGNTPYDGSNARQHELALAERIGILRDTGAIKAEERALKRLGLLDGDADLAALLETLYGQALPVAYFEDEGNLSVLEPNDKLNAAQRAQAARELDRALTDQNFGLQGTRIGDKTRGDQALAVYSLEQGDGTSAMIEWSAAYGNDGQTNDVIVPGDDAILASMPLILQREYSFPFLEGRLFVDRVKGDSGWATIDGVWGRLPESTEQILHPALYPNDRPTTIVMDGIAGRLGDGWSEGWQQTMGELRIGVWLADGAAGEQSGPRAAVKLPRANAAAGWGGDRLVSLDGPDGRWAIVWQTKWDTAEDTNQFANAANAVIAGLGGVGVVTADDVSSGVSNPALVLIADSADTLASVAAGLGVVVAVPS